MFQTKLLIILPLVVAVTVGQANSGYSYYGTSYVRDQKPQIKTSIYRQKPLLLPRRPMPVTGPPTAAPGAPIAPAPVFDAPSAPAAPPALAASSYAPVRHPRLLYTPVYRPLLPPRSIKPELPAITPPQPYAIAEPQPVAEAAARHHHLTYQAPILPEPAVEQPEYAPIYIPDFQPGEPEVVEPLPEPVPSGEPAPVTEEPPAPLSEAIPPSTVVSEPLPQPEPISQPEPIWQPELELQPESVPVVVTTQSHPAVTQAPGQLKFDFLQCKEGDGYYSVVHECDTYIECKQNRAMKHTCPNGLHFNPAAKHIEYPCAYPSEVKCMPGDHEQNPKPTAKCPNQYGFYSKNDGDCSQFIMCQEGLATIMNCPMGLAFNPQTSSCDWPANVPQCNLNAFKDFTCPPEDEDGQVSDKIYKYRYEGQCKLYITCQLGHPRLLSCERGLSFDDASQTCIDEDYVTDCSVPVEHLQ